ncbi:hypothetical protein HPL003_14135 [Paenibacillus terrae HPL-003]|uniref:Uncharacterized protein n=1 Tax=Paenibacillus terrae (strain HPL-003) TaxID=985665 RepID=G7W0F7_PAETH|nr:hypothetical protein HPL003_14135 [Paenibacillus terrae HPL-003]
MWSKDAVELAGVSQNTITSLAGNVIKCRDYDTLVILCQEIGVTPDEYIPNTAGK